MRTFLRTLLFFSACSVFGQASWCLTNPATCVANWRMSMIVTNGSMVSVPDYNGSPYALSNGAASSTRPTMLTNSIGTSNVLRFDGTNQYLWNASFAVS